MNSWMRAACRLDVRLCRPFVTTSACGKKGLIRRPLRVFTPEQSKRLAQGDKVDDTELPLYREPPNRFPNELTNKRFALPDGMTYVKLEDGDRRFRRVMATKVRKERQKYETILLEGQRLLLDAIDAGVTIKALYFSKVEHLENIPVATLNADLYKVSYRQLQLVSDVATSTGLMAVAELPSKATETRRESEALTRLPGAEEWALPVTVVCDNIRDPGNLGTIIRCIAATGCRRLILTKGCVDPWDPKALRAGAGAHFRCNIVDNVAWEMIANYLHDCEQVFLAENKAKYVDFAEGLHPGGLLKTMMNMEDDESLELGGGKSRGVKKGGEIHRMDVMSVYDADFTQGEIALVLGGETHGLSLTSYRVATQFNGVCVNLPMAPGVESLNAAVALTAILFEAKRQCLLQKRICESDREDSTQKDEAVRSE